jgi:acyl-CoA synthetase (NDP forming)
VNSGGRIVDLTMAGAKPEVVRGVISDLMATPEIEAVVMVVGSSARFHPDLAVDPLLSWARADKPVAVYLVPDAEESLHRLAQGGVPVFRTAETCADALSGLLRWHAPIDFPTVELAPTISSKAASLTELRALKVISDLGIAVAPSGIAHNAEEVGRIAAQIGFPVAIKVVSTDIAHKSEVGGVQLNVRDAAEASHAYKAIMESVRSMAPDARIESALVQRMVSGLAEVIVGYIRDPAAGPFVMVGVGGVLAELYDDTSVRVAPVSVEVAREMIEEVVGLAPIRGYRNLPRGDLTSLTDAIVCLSKLAGDEKIAEAEINPLVVGAEGEGVVAADGLIAFDTTEKGEN